MSNISNDVYIIKSFNNVINALDEGDETSCLIGKNNLGDYFIIIDEDNFIFIKKPNVLEAFDGIGNFKFKIILPDSESMRIASLLEEWVNPQNE